MLQSWCGTAARLLLWACRHGFCWWHCVLAGLQQACAALRTSINRAFAVLKSSNSSDDVRVV
jgi:hypothetical protein